ncbi:hypothetical protein [Endozoicomonas sp. ALB032]|uniref:hypothetical protein n=1 Tax=Endozoicomonas sp. ALB032 TaxID=3403082 RepID=UPI003BB6FB0A
MDTIKSTNSQFVSDETALKRMTNSTDDHSQSVKISKKMPESKVLPFKNEQLVPNTNPEGMTSSKPYAETGLERKVDMLDLSLADTRLAQLQSSSPACMPAEEIVKIPATELDYRPHSESNNTETIRPWFDCFGQIYESLQENDHPTLEKQLYALREDQIESLLMAEAPRSFLTKHYTQNHASLLLQAARESEANKVFFKCLFDRLSTEELRIMLLKSVDDGLTLLHYASSVIEESLFKQLEQKLGRETLLEMVTLKVNNHAPPIAYACLYNQSTYLFNTALTQNRELIEKLLKGGPDIDESLLQFMFVNFGNYVLGKGLNNEEYWERLNDLSNFLIGQEFLDALRFAGKKNESVFLTACKNVNSWEFYKLIAAKLSDNKLFELCKWEVETGKSLLHKCFEINHSVTVMRIVHLIQSALLRFKVLSLPNAEGDSVFQRLLVENDFFYSNNNVKDILRDMDSSERNQLVIGDANIWEQSAVSSDRALRQQERNPIVVALNKENMSLAEYLWTQITDPQLRIKLLLYRSKHQKNLFQHILEKGVSLQWFNKMLTDTDSGTERDLLAAELYKIASKADRMKDASYYLSQIRDSQLIKDVSKDHYKYFLANLYKQGKKLTEADFSKTTPSQCTDAITYIFEHSFYTKEYPGKNHLPLLMVQENRGDKDAFVKWALSPLNGKQSPLIKILERFTTACLAINSPDKSYLWGKLFLESKSAKKEIMLSRPIFQKIIKMMTLEQIREWLLPELGGSNNLYLLVYKDILEPIVERPDGSGKAFLEKTDPKTGENLLHIIFRSNLINENYVDKKNMIDTVEWLDKIYGLTSFLQSHSENDGSTPLHVLLNAEGGIRRSRAGSTQKNILQRLCRTKTDRIHLVELLKLKDNNGCTPLHKLFSFYRINYEIVDLLIDELGLGTFRELVNIKDNQDEPAIDVGKFEKKLNSDPKYAVLFKN